MMHAVATWEHVQIFLAGSTTLGLIAHAVNTFPTPTNQYGQWLLGCVKFVVGQRLSAMNVMRGQDTLVAGVPKGTGSGGTAQSTQTTSTVTAVTPDVITTATEKVTKTEVSVPNPHVDKTGE